MDSIVAALDTYLAGLDAAGRQREVNAVWLEPPITQAEAVAAYPPLSDHFDVLQGDVIRTEAAFVLGRRVVGAYVVASATCDAVIRPRPQARLNPSPARDPADPRKFRREHARGEGERRRTAPRAAPDLPDDWRAITRTGDEEMGFRLAVAERRGT